MAKIDERSTIPVTWLVIALYTMGGLLFIIAAWVFQVNYRLARIETALNLKSESVAKLEIIPSAAAAKTASTK